MQVKLDAFRALVLQKVRPPVSAVGTAKGFCLMVGDDTLGTEAGGIRVFKNLTTLARFAKSENVDSLALRLAQMPKSKKRVAKAAAVAPKKQAARKAATAA